ncbi:tetratricopeptide repeat protein [uncultured Methanobrevibacter sp.]|uniref:tetratricopeptide repeat protein n=1 Tax=uncultured Methanobrevibacter sp. TaxID=253161 RepID=UPI003182E9A8
MNKSLELGPNNADILYNKRYILEKLKRYQESLEYYDKSLKINNNDTDALEGLERVLKKIKDIN